MLVDEIIEQMYGNVIAFDYKRAECVIELIVQCSVTAKWAFRSLLKDMRTGRRSDGTAGVAPIHGETGGLLRSGSSRVGCLTAVTLGEGRSMNIPSQISNALVTVSL